MINLKSSNAIKKLIPPYYSDVGTLRVKKSKYEENNGDPRVVLETEIIAPSEVEVDGVKYNLAGQEITFYCSLNSNITGKQKQSPLDNLLEFHTKLGLPEDLDPENLPYENLLFDFMLQSNEKILQRRIRLSDGSFEYEAILGPDNKPRKQGWQWASFINGAIGPSSLSIETVF